KIIAINLKGMLHCTKAALPHMAGRQYGKIVNIASDAGRAGSTGEGVYSACKGGIIAFTKTLAREVARHKINVNCVCPGPTETLLFQSLGESELGQRIVEGMRRAVPLARPLGRIGQPQDIANAVAFLASDEAEWITGQTLSVSGGLTMQ
ncbi:MAG: SDR family oxidoreductase, partial [Dehalococcoidia bacterium]